MNWRQRALRGAAAGAAATTAMSAVMLASERLGFVSRLPPERIVDAGFDTLGTDPAPPEEHATATVAHYGYGMGNGALFGVVAPSLPIPRARCGLRPGLPAPELRRMGPARGD